jgi:alpha/beta superfamily hydrolase
MHYMSHLRPHPSTDATFTPEQSPVPPNSNDLIRTLSDACPIVILGGYSYGSLILKHLPPVPTILKPFAAPLAGSSADEILLRAYKLADQSNLEWINLARDEARARKRSRNGHESRPSITMGGEETTPDKRRSSRDIRRSVDGSARLEIRTRLRSLSHKGRKDGVPATPPETKSAIITIPKIRYLLVSPLTPPISTLLAPALGPKFWNKSKGATEDVIDKHASLVVYGDQDTFTSARRIRDWSDQLKIDPASRFTGVEVAGAGHFWMEGDAEEKLRAALREWEPGMR